jgi:two-component system, NtrC family, nitrogen regulation sensor histidine kinase NtrY
MSGAVIQPVGTWTQRLRLWADRVHLAGKLAIALTVAAVASGFATYGALTGAGFAADPGTVLLLLNLDLILLLLLGAVVARRIVQLWAERRRGSAGSRLHVRLVVMFSALAAAPAIVVALFSALFFNLGVQSWFSDRVRIALRESIAVAEAYLEEHRNTIRADILAMTADLNAELNNEGPTFITNQRRIDQFINAQADIRNLPEVVLFSDQGQVYGKSRLTLSVAFGIIPNWALQKAREGEVVILTPEDDEVGGTLTDRVRALARVEHLGGVYLMVGRFVEEKVVAHVERTSAAVAAYESLEGRRSGLQITFAMVFVMVALLLLLAAVWTGLLFATRLVQPIAALSAAAERVRSGDLSVRVEEGTSDDELGSLSRAFNRMTSQLQTQRGELVEANRQIDDRRRFTEAVLSGVSAGVVGLDADGKINLPNRSATVLLSTDLDRMIGRDFREAVPEMAVLFDAARADPNRLAQNEVAIQRGGRRRTLLVRIAGERVAGGTIGFVVTFDDVTELEAAQRKAAWADVARRIAHEIKNPLTPIQLSAERLKRKYLGEITSDPETFRICTETIVRQVSDIGRMVDEFSSFARMPAPVMRSEDLVELVRQTVFLQRNARQEIAFETELPDHPVRLPLDQRQVGQALTNLLQNAVDAIHGRDPAAELAPGRIVVHVQKGEGQVAVAVEDNGKGLPADNRDRLTEPYVTTRSKGTGLGLAIVKKIMEDHGGELMLADRPEGGAIVTLIFSVHTAAQGAADTTGSMKAAAHGS